MEKKQLSNSEGKYYYRFASFILLSATALLLFVNAWLGFVTKNNFTGRLLGIGNIGMSAIIYTLLYTVVGFNLHAFKIGVDRTANVIASQVLTVLIVDFIEILVSCAITGQFRFANDFLLRYSLLFIVESFVLGLMCVPLIKIYRKIFPPLQVLEIYGNNENDLYRKMDALRFKYIVCEKVHFSMLGFTSYSSFRYNDLIYDDHVRSDTEGRTHRYNAQEAITVVPVETPRLVDLIDKYDAVLINDVPAHEKNMILKTCFDHDKRVYLVPKIGDIIIKASEELNLLDTPLFLCRNHGMSTVERIIKRVMDIVVSLLALIFFSPILLLTAVLIKLQDGGPVFFCQERCTIGGKVFKIIKFRSMIVDAEKDGKPHPAGEKDDRITKVGRIIRATRIDELPQFLNILRGDMSIVGPRPERIEHVKKYTAEIPEFSLRSKVKGGLTGYAQVYGKYNTTALDKLKMDLVYILNYSILLDLQIIIETIKILFQKESTEGFNEERVAEMHDGTVNLSDDVIE